MHTLTQLYPQADKPTTARGVYLKERIHEQHGKNSVFLYANFVTSLDGRIALKGEERSFMPKGLSNPKDFRLFLELQAQADCLVTHSGYLRELAGNSLGNVLQVGIQEGHEDLAEWRMQEALALQPDIMVVSNSLDFPDPREFLHSDQKVSILASHLADKSRVEHWQQQGFEVTLVTSREGIDAQSLLTALQQRQYRSAYMVAGPMMLESLMRQQLLDRLYLTHRLRLLGGEQFHSLIPGSPLNQQGTLELRSLLHDNGSQDECGQLFASYSV